MLWYSLKGLTKLLLMSTHNVFSRRNKKNIIWIPLLTIAICNWNMDNEGTNQSGIACSQVGAYASTLFDRVMHQSFLIPAPMRPEIAGT